MGPAAALYGSVGNELTHYDIDADAATLAPRATIKLPANVMYVWPHPSKRYVYVASSPRGPGGVPGSGHHLSAFRIDPDTGALEPHGEPQSLPHRPVHMSLDRTGAYALTAHNEPSAITVHRINADGTLGAEVQQSPDLDTGIFAHQILASPSNRTVILVTRGNDAKAGKAEDPGALKLYDFRDGVLSNKASIAPDAGLGFGPRHIDFHPTKPWVYVSLERQNRLQVYALEGDGLSASPLYTKDCLAKPNALRPRQLVGTVHVHPNGRFVYVANRADHTIEHEGKEVFGGGENSIVVFAIDQNTGEPTPIQYIDPQSIHVRTFAFDPSGRVMVAASIKGITMREGNSLRNVPTALSVFRVGEDGKLTFARKYDIETGGRHQFWMGIVGLRPLPKSNGSDEK